MAARKAQLSSTAPLNELPASPSNKNNSASPGNKGRSPASKVGLGPVTFNLKPHHYYSRNSAKKCHGSTEPSFLHYYRQKYPAIKKLHPARGGTKVKGKGKTSSLELEDDPLSTKMKKLTIYEDAQSEIEDKMGNNKVSNRNNLIDKALESYKAKVRLYEAGQTITQVVDEEGTKVTFKKSSSAIRKAGVRNWKSPDSTSEDIHSGPTRNLFEWSLQTSSRWKEVEDRVARWSKLGSAEKNNSAEVTVEQIAELLNISVEDFKNFQCHKDLRKVCDILKELVCHSCLPSLTSAVALTELQLGNLVGSTKNAADSQGTFLHSEIIDKHICYISRNEDFNPSSNQRSSFSTKAELFRKQIKDTLEFGRESATDDKKNSDYSEFTRHVSSFNPDWNIVQITAFLPSKNRFGVDLTGRRQIPQLLLSALAHVPNEKDRTCFTAFCPDPPIFEGSSMRLGLMEEFQKILDRNLIISDDSTIISRRNYWEERSKHNNAMMCVIEAMEESWIGTWSFLLPGHTTKRDLQDKIISKIVTPATKKYKLSSAQKLLLYKLTENYKYLSPNTSNSLETVMSFILKVPELGLSSLSKKIRDIGLEIPQGERHPTILVVDQDLEIYPWESMNCLVNTDVTRMPSLNLIRSNYNFAKSLRPTYPNIVDSNSCTVVLNPDGSLPNVQKRLEQYFTDHKTWLPIISRPPTTKEVQECLENQHIFLYNGHGAGSNFYPDYLIQKLVCQAVPLLMGCASAQFHYSIPRVYGSSTVHSYFLAGCPSVVGYLWEVTDAECDRITVDLIERWLPDKNIRPPKILFFDQDAKREREKCLPTALRMSRKAATQFLTQCAIVCYGLPINTTD